MMMNIPTEVDHTSYWALVGDRRRGIAGVPGIGPRGAIRLLRLYPSLATIIATIDGSAGGDPLLTLNRPMQLLMQHRDAAAASYRVAQSVSVMCGR